MVLRVAQTKHEKHRRQFQHLSMHLSIYLSFFLTIYLLVYLTIFLSVCLSVCLSIDLSACLSLSLYLSFSLSQDRGRYVIYVHDMCEVLKSPEDAFGGHGTCGDHQAARRKNGWLENHGKYGGLNHETWRMSPCNRGFLSIPNCGFTRVFHHTEMGIDFIVFHDPPRREPSVVGACRIGGKWLSIVTWLLVSTCINYPPSKDCLVVTSVGIVNYYQLSQKTEFWWDWYGI